MDPCTAVFGNCIRHTGAKDEALAGAQKAEAGGGENHGVHEREVSGKLAVGIPEYDTLDCRALLHTSCGSPRYTMW